MQLFCFILCVVFTFAYLYLHTSRIVISGINKLFLLFLLTGVGLNDSLHSFFLSEPVCVNGTAFIITQCVNALYKIYTTISSPGLEINHLPCTHGHFHMTRVSTPEVKILHLKIESSLEWLPQLVNVLHGILRRQLCIE